MPAIPHDYFFRTSKFLIIAEPFSSKISSDLLNVSNACLGVSTIASPCKLKEVFKTTG